MPFASWGGTIVKDVPKMAAAAPAMAFCARPQQHVIGLGPDRIAQAGVKAGPTRAAIVFRITGITYQITAATMVNPIGVILFQGAGACTLCRLMAHDLILQAGQHGLPFSICAGHLKRIGKDGLRHRGGAQQGQGKCTAGEHRACSLGPWCWGGH